MTDREEPIAAEGRDRRDRRTAEMRALRSVLLFAVILGGVVLANTLIGLVLLEAFDALEAKPAGFARRAAA
jgi:hypothetical protein